MYRRSEGGLCSASPSFWRKCCCAQHNALQYPRVLGCVAIGRQRLNAAVSRLLNAMHTNAKARAGDHYPPPPPPPHRTHTHTHTSPRVRCIVGSCAHEVSVCPPPFSSTPCPAAPMPQWGGAWAIRVGILCADLCCHPPDVPQGPCAAKRREVDRMVRGCVCVAEWLELGQAPGYECGCCSMVLCGRAVAVCRVEGPGSTQSAHTSGRPSAGPYSLRVS